MEDMDANASSTEFEPLFIAEEDGEPDRNSTEPARACKTAQSGLTFTGAQLNPSALISPYLQEMDDILKSCEELTGIPFGSRFSEGYTDTSMGESILGQSKEEVPMESYRETSLSPQAYFSTNYIDTHMDGAGTEDQPAHGVGTIINRCGMTTDVSHQSAMPVTLAGNRLSETMVEYEGQLLGMLAMLESCMEEAGMDFEPQDWATDVSHEYVHINKNAQLHRGTTLVPIQQERPAKLETQPMQLGSWAAQHAEPDKVSKHSRNEVMDSAANRSQQNPLLGCDNMDVISMETLERSVKTDQGVLGPSEPLDNNRNHPMYYEGTKSVFNEETETKADMTEVNDTEMPAQEMPKATNLEFDMSELGDLGPRMEQCIEEAQQLEKRRKELLAEVLELRQNKNREEAEGSDEAGEVTEEQIDTKVAGLLTVLKSEEQGRREERKRELQSLREDRAEEEKRMWKVNLERQGLQEELRKLKMRLFVMARDCTHSQASLNNQRREVELLRREEVKKRKPSGRILICALYL